MKTFLLAATLAICSLVRAEDKPIKIANAADQKIIAALQAQVVEMQRMLLSSQVSLNGCLALIAPVEHMQQPTPVTIPEFVPFVEPVKAPAKGN